MNKVDQNENWSVGHAMDFDTVITTATFGFCSTRLFSGDEFSLQRSPIEEPLGMPVCDFIEGRVPSVSPNQRS